MRASADPRASLLATATLLGLAAAVPAQTEPPGACTQESAAFATAEGGCKDLSSGVVWSLYTYYVPPHYAHTWPDADGYCANLVEGGYDDWRLPSIEEHQEALAHGVKEHVAWEPASWTRMWSSKTQGNWAYYVDWDTGEADRTLTRSSFFHFCVRGGSGGSGGGGHGGGHGGHTPSPPPAGGASDGATDAPSSTQTLDRATWAFDVDAPAHAGREFIVLVGVRGQAPAAAAASPLPIGTDGVLRRFDGAGRARVEIDRRGLEASQKLPKDVWVGLVVLDASKQGGVAEVLTLSRPAAPVTH